MAGNTVIILSAIATYFSISQAASLSFNGPGFSTYYNGNFNDAGSSNGKIRINGRTYDDPVSLISSTDEFGNVITNNIRKFPSGNASNQITYYNGNFNDAGSSNGKIRINGRTYDDTYYNGNFNGAGSSNGKIRINGRTYDDPVSLITSTDEFGNVITKNIRKYPTGNASNQISYYMNNNNNQENPEKIKLEQKMSSGLESTLEKQKADQEGQAEMLQKILGEATPKLLYSKQIQLPYRNNQQFELNKSFSLPSMEQTTEFLPRVMNSFGASKMLNGFDPSNQFQNIFGTVNPAGIQNRVAGSFSQRQPASNGSSNFQLNNGLNSVDFGYSLPQNNQKFELNKSFSLPSMEQTTEFLPRVMNSFGASKLLNSFDPSNLFQNFVGTLNPAGIQNTLAGSFSQLQPAINGQSSFQLNNGLNSFDTGNTSPQVKQEEAAASKKSKPTPMGKITVSPGIPFFPQVKMRVF